jgi:ubiquinone/menaquinone biosynthesis C-methylase UbiE
MSLVQDLSCKIRFALSRLPYFPVTYRLTDEQGDDLAISWSKIMPFFDHKKSLFNFDLWGWDVPELRFLNKFLTPGMMFLDIGAYHGIYSIVVAKRVGPTGQVYTFEPNPQDMQRRSVE